MDASVLFIALIVIAFFAVIISYNLKRPSVLAHENNSPIQRPTSSPTDRERIIQSLGLNASDEGVDEVIEAARKVYNDVYDCVMTANTGEEVAGFLARLIITNPYLIQKSQFKAILDLEVLMDKGAVHNEDGSLWNLELLKEVLNSMADFFLEKVDSHLFASEESKESADFGVKFGFLETLVKGAGGLQGSGAPSEATSAFLNAKADEEEARIIEEEYFEWWLVHWIIEEEERRRESQPDRSIFTHKESYDSSFYEQDLLYDEAYDGGGDVEEVYDDYDNYWDRYDAGDVDDLDLDD